MTRVAATSIVNLVAPRTFREPRPGITFFFDRAAADGRSFEGVFLRLGDDVGRAGPRSSSRARARLTLEGDQLWLDLGSPRSTSSTPTIRPETASAATRPSGCCSRARRPTPGLERPRPARPALAGASPSSGRRLTLSSQTLPTAGSPGSRSTRSSPFRWRASPSPSSVFRSARRFAAEAAGELRAVARGPARLLPAPDRAARPGRRRGGFRRRSRCGSPTRFSSGSESPRRSSARRVALPHAPRPRVPAEHGAPDAPACRPGPKAAPPADAAPPPRRSWPRLLSLLDRYVLARFLSALLLVFASAMLLSIVVDYADKLDEVARHHPPFSAILGFYRYFVLSIAIQIAPFAVLLAALVGLGVLSKNTEDTAFKASGVSLWRLAAPVAVLVGLGAVARLRRRRVRPADRRAAADALSQPHLRPAGRLRHPHLRRTQLVSRAGRPDLVPRGERSGAQRPAAASRSSVSTRTSR